ncbi:MAG TPA: FAD-dependent oxidoreductase [Pirellulales bacterium]|nr:FAD-dependent oxidoreductase [Pirellulales bacterium]
MNQNQNLPSSPWPTTAAPPRFAALSKDAHADVCIVGAGIAGLSTAYLLARQGRSVIVLDHGSIASGQTQRTTAHLSNAIDDRYTEIEKIHGQDGARLAAESHTAAIDRIEAICQAEGIECDFQRVDGYLFTPPGESTDILDQEYEAARRAGLTDVELVARAPLDSFDTGPALRFPRQGQFHPLKYLTGLARAIQSHGGQIFCDTHVSRVDGGETAHIQIKNGQIKDGPSVTADAVVVATNAPINDLVAIHTKQAPYVSYAIAGRVPRGSLTRALYWDTLEYYHFVRLQPLDDGSDLLIVGGEDHKEGQANDGARRWANLEQWTRERFPMFGAVEHRWSGIVLETTDGLAFIGPNPLDKENVFIATGDSGMGMTHGAIAGILLTDLIVGRDNPWSSIYDPSRKPVWGMAWKEYLIENINVAKQYARDWLTGGDVSSVDEIPRGRGAVVRRGMRKIAAYRDEQGSLHECSAVCTHLGCIVHWADASKTWDCPCHGSQFDPHGQVVNGPANTPLEPIEAEQAARSG